MPQRAKPVRYLAWCSLSLLLLLLVLHGRQPVLADQTFRGPCYDGYECVPNAENFGYFRTTWRRWPGESRTGEDFPTSIGREVLPTPKAQKQPPLGEPTRLPSVPGAPGGLPPAGGLMPGPGGFIPEPPIESPWATPIEPILPEGLPGGLPNMSPSGLPDGLPGQPTAPQTPPPLLPPPLQDDLPGPGAPGSGTPDEPVIREPNATAPGGARLPKTLPLPLAEKAIGEPRNDLRHAPELALHSIGVTSIFEQQDKLTKAPQGAAVDPTTAPLEELPRLAPSATAPKPIAGQKETGKPALEGPAVAAVSKQPIMVPPKVVAPQQPETAAQAAKAPAGEASDDQATPPVATAAAAPTKTADAEPVEAASAAAPNLNQAGAASKPPETRPLQANWMEALHPGFRGDVGRSNAMQPPITRGSVVSYANTSDSAAGNAAERPRLRSSGVQAANHLEASRPGSAGPVALDGFCCVDLCTREQWTPGDPRWTAAYQGRTYLFAGPKQRQRFLAAPNRFAPMCSGNDPVFSADENRRVTGRTDFCVTYDGRLYMFSSAATLKRFQGNPRRYVDAAAKP